MAAVIIDELEMTPGRDATIRELLCVCFPPDRAVFSQTRAWNGSGPAFSAVVERDGRIVAHLGVVDRTIRVGAAALRVAGIQNVAVDPAERGRGLTAETMTAALAEARGRGFDAALLFCIPGLEAMYGRLGFRVLPPTAVTRVHRGVEVGLPANHSVMFCPLGSAEFPAGDIHLMGDDW